MTWEDTVLREVQIRATCLGEGIYWAGEQWTTADKPLPVLMPQFQRIAEAQAKETWDIAFKAGIMEVVELILANKCDKKYEYVYRHYCPNCDHHIYGLTDYLWRAFLKEKGIEEVM